MERKQIRKNIRFRQGIISCFLFHEMKSLVDYLKQRGNHC